MSHFTTVRTRIVDAGALVAALADLGFEHVEVHETAQRLHGFLGDARPQTAEVIIRRKRIGWLSNDIGFKRSTEGTFEAIISEFDSRKYSQEWLGRLLQRYAYHVAKDQLARQGFELVAEETQADRTIHITVRRMGP